jgi:hypothetical protein
LALVLAGKTETDVAAAVGNERSLEEYVSQRLFVGVMLALEDQVLERVRHRRQPEGDPEHGGRRPLVRARDEGRSNPTRSPTSPRSSTGTCSRTASARARAAPTADAVFKAVTSVRLAPFVEPDAIVMHPTDFQTAFSRA